MAEEQGEAVLAAAGEVEKVGVEGEEEAAEVEVGAGAEAELELHPEPNNSAPNRPARRRKKETSEISPDRGSFQCDCRSHRRKH